jgi:NADH:ubiquinone oxidoreductase subunit E
MKSVAWASGAAAVACVVLLIGDWGIAAYHAPKDDTIIKQYQKQVKENAAVAATLEAEQKRITAGRLARRQRDRAAGWMLLAAAAAFLLTAPRGRRRFVEIGKLKSPAPMFRARKQPGKVTEASEDCDFEANLVARYGRGRESAIPLLQAMQAHYRYLPDAALQRVCDLTGITPAEISGVATFYGQFRQTPVGKHLVRVCHGTACHVAGARQISEELRRCLKLPEGVDTDASHTFTLEDVACLGCCSLAPVIMVDEQTAGRLTPSAATAAIADIEHKEPA